jgi:UDP-N-acetyl-D-mannosaminuronic acid dehydrogenase
MSQNFATEQGSNQNRLDLDVVIIGGLGHVGLPLGIIFANKGLNVGLYDLSQEKAAMVQQGIMPFIEYDAEPLLRSVINKNLHVSVNIEIVCRARTIIMAIGTPVDEYLNPKLRAFSESIEQLKQYLRPEQTIIIRSTVYPGTCRQIDRLLSRNGEQWHIAYSPERIIQGYAIRELVELPQLISGLTDKAIQDSSQLFGLISPKLIEVSVEEAELSKLFANAWRYIQFAVSNQFYMISEKLGVDFNKVRQALIDEYGRAANLPTAGFAAGPCLLKDTMQLAAFNNNNFLLGHAAMMVNEGLPNFVVDQLEQKIDIHKSKIGILGMTFKADIDDIRDSLSYKLGKILRFRGATVLYSDEFASDPTFVSTEKILELSDVVIIGVPHSAYRELKIPPQVKVIDLWGVVE